MKVNKYEEKLEWLADRRGRITGSRVKDVISSTEPKVKDIVERLKNNKVEFDVKAKKEDLLKLLTPEDRGYLRSLADKKIGYYELIAERLGLPDDGENPMERGSRLEAEALERFAKEADRNVNTDLVIWEREDNPDIAISPDGVVDDGTAVEVKCLSSARHIEAYLTKKVPDEYWYQVLQYFVVNDDLKTLHFVCYDPRFSMFVPTDSKQSKLDYFVIYIERKDVEAEVKECLEYQRNTLKEVQEVINQLTF